jgi:fumarate reductase subunit D
MVTAFDKPRHCPLLYALGSGPITIEAVWVPLLMLCCLSSSADHGLRQMASYCCWFGSSFSVAAPSALLEPFLQPFTAFVFICILLCCSSTLASCLLLALLIVSLVALSYSALHRVHLITMRNKSHHCPLHWLFYSLSAVLDQFPAAATSTAVIVLAIFSSSLLIVASSAAYWIGSSLLFLCLLSQS